MVKSASSLLSFQRGCLQAKFLHSGRDGPFAWPRRAVKPQRPRGLRRQAQGLDGASARRATIGHRANSSLAELLSTFVGRFSLIVRSRSSVPKFDQGWSPLLNVCSARRIIVRSCAPENTDAPHAFALLRPRGELPSGCRATECEYKLSSPDVDCHLTRPQSDRASAMRGRISWPDWQVCGRLHGGLTPRKVAVFLAVRSEAFGPSRRSRD